MAVKEDLRDFLRRVSEIARGALYGVDSLGKRESSIGERSALFESALESVITEVDRYVSQTTYLEQRR